MRKIFREIDWDTVALPSDCVTLGQLRHAIGGNHKDLGVFVHNLTLTEQEVARFALSEALRAPFDQDAALVPRVLKEESAKELASLYQEAGLATGPQHASQLIRDLESWAATEARKHVPDKPR
ncbi:MAG TPA: hypothetical protein VK395_04145 [Gemmataceae bacterium]|nr:hypothetical protein [Gemmataceae bacterium]